MPPEPPLANERTALGWQRSSLSLGVIATILLGHAVHVHEPAGIGAAVIVGGCALWVGRLGRRLYRSRVTAQQGPAARELRAVTLVTLLAAALAAAVVLAGTPA
jgi:uncharacterized membrane protein YidH (DUF202 family)